VRCAFAAHAINERPKNALEGLTTMSDRILIIEDNTINMELMIYLLKSFGFQPILAFDGQTGVDMATLTQPRLILCDINLPGMSGIGVLRLLRASEETRHIPVVAVTGMAMAGDAERLLSLGFNGYIAKPFEPENLQGQLAEFLKQSGR
jgi:CheY-like chemotaxis protein